MINDKSVSGLKFQVTPKSRKCRLGGLNYQLKNDFVTFVTNVTQNFCNTFVANIAKTKKTANKKSLAVPYQSGYFGPAVRLLRTSGSVTSG